VLKLLTCALMSDLEGLEVVSHSTADSAWGREVAELALEGSTIEESVDANLEVIPVVEFSDSTVLSVDRRLLEKIEPDSPDSVDVELDPPGSQIVDRPLNTFALLVHTAHSTPDNLLDADAVRVAEHMLLHKTHAPSTTQDESSALGVSRKRFREYRSQVASFCFGYMRYVWRALEGSLSAKADANPSKLRLVSYLEFPAYDGVDLSLRSRARKLKLDGTLAIENSSAEAIAIAQGSIGCVASPLLPKGSDTLCAMGPTKVLQSSNIVAMLVEAEGQYIVLHSEHLCPLTTVDRNTAEALTPCVNKMRPGSVHREKFKRKTRVAATDKGGANPRIESGIARTQPDWSLLHIFCHIHVGYAVHTKTFKFVDPYLADCMCYSKSVSGLGELVHLELSYRRVIRSKLQFVEMLTLSHDALAFKDFVIRTFFGVGPDSVEPRAVLLRCCPGNWLDSRRFEYVLGPGETEADALAMIDDHLVSLLCGRQPFRYPKSRWFGAEKTFRDVGLPGCVHNLGQDAYNDYLVHWHRFEMPDHSAQTGSFVSGARPLEDISLDGGADVDDARAPTSGDHIGGPELSWAELKKAYRGRAYSLWKREPKVGHLCLGLTLILDPIRTYLGQQADMAGHDFDVQELVNVKCRSLTAEQLLAARKTALGVAALGVHDKQCMDQLGVISDPLPWAHFPNACKTLSFSTLMFKMISRAGATTHYLLSAPHKKFPFLIFTWILQPASRARILAMCPSSTDAFSCEVLKHVRDGSLPRDLEIELLVILLLSRTATVRIEALNSLLQRILRKKSTQTTRPDIKVVSEEFCLHVLRMSEVRRRHHGGHTRARHASNKHNASPKASSLSVPKPSADVPDGRGGGGAWRCFVRERTRGICKAVFSALAVEYNDLPPEERAGYAEQGALGTAVHAAGGKSFGEVTRLVGRAVQREAVRERLTRDLENTLCVRPCGTLVPLQRDAFATNIAKAKADLRVIRAIASQSRITSWNEFNNFLKTDGARITNSAVAKLPELAPIVLGLSGHPCGNVCHLLSWRCPVFADVPRIVSLLRDASFKSAKDKMLAEWSELHTTHVHGEQASIVDEPKRKAHIKPSCFEACVCLCGDLSLDLTLCLFCVASQCFEVLVMLY
jgi:hypothetical protein